MAGVRGENNALECSMSALNMFSDRCDGELDFISCEKQLATN